MQVNNSQRRYNKKATAFKQKASNLEAKRSYNDFVPTTESKLNNSSAVFYPTNNKDEKTNSCVVL